MGYLLKEQGISDVDIDTRPDIDVPYSEKADAINSGEKYCTRDGTHCSKDAKSKQGPARAVLISYIEQHQSPVLPDKGGYQYTFEVTSANLEDFLSNPHSKLTPACFAPETPEAAPSPTAAGDPSRAPGRLVIRQNIGDLTVSQTDQAFKSLQQASFGITDDQIKSSTTYNVQGVVGYAFGQAPVPGWQGAFYELVPFAAYTRQFVQGTNPNKISEVDNVGGGFSL